jgi:crossover junction endodeoxyribonuclease RuvC
MKAYIGIDPGQSGAVALLPGDDPHRVEDWPGDPSAAAEVLKGWSIEYQVQLAALESVHAMPKQGVSSTFRFGANWGTWQVILAALGLPYLMPRPTEWQKGLVRKSDGPDPKSQVLGSGQAAVPGCGALQEERSRAGGCTSARMVGEAAKLVRTLG